MNEIIVLPLLSALILACCGTSAMTATCPENDLSCFSQYAEAGCEPVKMDYSLDVPVSMEITGQDSGGNCAITLTALSEQKFRDTLLTNGLSEAEVDEYFSEIDYEGTVAGKTAYCSIPPDSAYEFASQGTGMETCSGPLLDAIMSIAR